MQPVHHTNEAAMPGIEDTIKALEEKLKQAKAKRQQIEARKRAVDQKTKRREDTRRKILVGAVILAKVERSEWPESRLQELMDKALTRNDDRVLFGLPPKPVLVGQEGNMSQGSTHRQNHLHPKSDTRDI